MLYVNEQSHVITSKVSEHELESLRSALREACTEIDALQNELLARDDALKEVRGELDLVKAELQKFSTEQAVIEVNLLCKQFKMQSAGAKRFWSQKCEDQLAHEIVLEQKDELLTAKTAKITNLQEEMAKLKIVNATNTLVMKPPVHNVSPESQQDTESVHGGSSVSVGSKSSR